MTPNDLAEWACTGAFAIVAVAWAISVARGLLR